jgi:hypothetical protein
VENAVNEAEEAEEAAIVEVVRHLAAVEAKVNHSEAAVAVSGRLLARCPADRIDRSAAVPVAAIRFAQLTAVRRPASHFEVVKRCERVFAHRDGVRSTQASGRTNHPI